MMRKVRALSLPLLFILLLTSACYAQQGAGVGCVSDVGDKGSLKDCCAGKTCVQTVQFKSKLVGATLPYKVILPVGYNPREAAQTARFPVIYLLHGFAGHYDNWTGLSKLAEHASAYNFIIVTPEGNNNWYTDSATVPTDKYESYILQELIPDVESRYRAIQSREGRAIAGLSMGGYGALKFGFKHPETFAFAASLSGAMDASSWVESDLRNFGAELPRSVMATFGPAGSQTRAANDLIRIAREFPAARFHQLPYFYLDCGTEDFLIQTSRNFSALLLERKIPHEFRQLPGSHNWAYWDMQVREVMRVAAQKIPQARLSSVARLQQSPRPAAFAAHLLATIDNARTLRAQRA
ncbi:MAG TPA: alpha/beta hydrolase family protein [Pyrinomonadaceae bacterium]|jgi:S-formylglutathione hydrolase FrmB